MCVYVYARNILPQCCVFRLGQNMKDVVLQLHSEIQEDSQLSTIICNIFTGHMKIINDSKLPYTWTCPLLENKKRKMSVYYNLLINSSRKPNIYNSIKLFIHMKDKSIKSIYK